MSGIRFAVVVLALVALAATPGFSSTIAYTQAQLITGNQTWSGSLGMDFEVLSSIVVTQIGVFSNNAFGQTQASPLTDLNAAIFVLSGGYDSGNGGIIAATEVSFDVRTAYAVTDNWLFQTITPVVLLPGYYSIVAQGYNSSDPNGNLGFLNRPASIENTGGGLISFGGGARYGGQEALPNPVDFPGTIDGGPSNRYYAGDFQYNGVPEPVSFALFGSGLVLVSVLGRKRFTR